MPELLLDGVCIRVARRGAARQQRRAVKSRSPLDGYISPHHFLSHSSVCSGRTSSPNLHSMLRQEPVNRPLAHPVPSPDHRRRQPRLVQSPNLVQVLIAKDGLPLPYPACPKDPHHGFAVDVELGSDSLLRGPGQVPLHDPLRNGRRHAWH